MLTARSVIITVVTIAMLSLLGVVAELAQPPDSGGLGHDSYGTRAHGHRGVYEILEELKLPVSRGLVPPDVAVKGDACLVLWSPDSDMIQVEPVYLGKVAAWVRGGGKLIVAPSTETATGRFMPRPKGGAPPPEYSLLDELGLKELRISSFDPGGAATLPTPLSQAEKEAGEPPAKGPAAWMPQQKAREYFTLAVAADGELASHGGAVAKIHAPKEDFRVLDPAAGPAPSGRLTHTESDGTVRVVAATFPVGDGEVTVIGDPTLFFNEAISKDDNAVLAAHLFHRCGRRIVFDEFYHGLTVRGNPAWLLTRQPYGLFALMIVLACALWAWRESVHLGPPLEEIAASRRTVREYIEAMANLFFRNGCHAFVLKEVHDGVLWTLRKRLGLSPKRESVADIARALERRDPQAAARLRDAAADADAVLQGKRPATEMAVVRSARKLAGVIS